MTREEGRADAAATNPAPSGLAFAVVGGHATDEDVAVLAAVLAAATSTRGAVTDTAPACAWQDRRALLRRPLPTGPTAWRFSAFPS